MEFSNRSNRAENPDNFNGKYVELMNDVDFKDVRSYENADRTDFGDVNGNGTVEGLRTELTTGTGWQPIASSLANAFSGTFNGNGNEIKNLYINNSVSGKRLGLFANIGNSTISNLGVTGNINSSVDSALGGISGVVINNSTSNIINCYNKANIKSMASSNATGGIVGNGYGTLNANNCYNDILTVIAVNTLTNPVVVFIANIML